MATNRRSSRFGVRQPMRRKLVWARQGQSPSAVIPAASSVILPLLTGFQAGYGADPIGSTVTRIRLTLGFRAGTAGNSLRATVGIGVFPAGSTIATIQPAAAQHLDWMYWHGFFVEPVVATEFAQLMNFEQDVRAQRKMEELNEDLLLVIQNTHPTDGLAYSYFSSTLLKLP